MAMFANFSVRGQDAALSPTELKKLSIEELMAIEVTSVSRQSQKLTEVGSAIQVITHQDIRRSGATSLAEALRLASNLHVAQKNAHDWAISARGFNTDLANKLLVMIDGRTVYTPLFSGVFWDRQDYLLEDIDRIEVISGPGGTLWGSNAVNGVINIITKNASDSQGLYAEAGGGNQLKSFGGVRYGGGIGSKISYRAYGKFFSRNDAVFPDDLDAQDAWSSGQGGFRLDANASPASTFTLQGDYNYGDENFGTGGRGNFSGINVLGRWTRTFSEKGNMSLQLYYDRSHLTQPIPETRTADNSVVVAPAGVLREDLDTYDLDFQHQVAMGTHHDFIWGFGYRLTDDNVSNAPALAFMPTRLKRNLVSAFVQDKIAVSPSLSLVVGSKIEHNDYTGFEYEPSIRVLVPLNGNQTLWAAASRAVRIPSRVDRHIRLPTPAFSPLIDNLLIGGNDFISETLLAYEAGYRAQYGSGITGSVSVFYNVYDHLRSTSFSPPPAFAGLPLFYENNLEGESYGAELQASFQVNDWWMVRGGYSLLKSDVRVKPGKADFNNALNETADPENRFSVYSFADIGNRFQLDAALRFVDEFRYNISGAPGTVSAYAELDVRVAWQPDARFEVSACGQNLLHDQHAEYVISSPNPRSEIPRSVYLKIAVRL